MAEGHWMSAGFPMITHWLHPYLVVMRPSNGSSLAISGSIITNPFSGGFPLPLLCPVKYQCQRSRRTAQLIAL
jgi:hypothetical protein